MPTFEFKVPRDTLAAAGLPVPPEGDAVFRFELYATGREQLAIEQRLDEINGGLSVTTDMQLAVAQLTVKAREEAEAAVWPAGRPTADDGSFEAVTPEQDAAYRAAWQRASVMPQLTRLLDIQMRQELLAEWPVLARSIPLGWERPEDLRMPPGLRDRIVSEYAAAKLEASNRLGKPQPSGQ